MIALIVDDEQAVKEGMDILIDWSSYGISQVLYASNGREALAILEARKPDIMFCDMQMPIMDGRQLIEEMVARRLGTKVIAVSGYNDFEYVKATIQANGIDYILKPIDEGELIRALEKAILLCHKESKETENKLQYLRMNEAISIQYLREWLEGKRKYDENIQLSLRSLGIQGDEVFVALIVFQNPLAVKTDIFKGDGALMRFSLVNVVRELFGNSVCQLIDIDEFLYILLVDGKRVNTYKMILERFLNATNAMYKLKFFFEFDNELILTSKVFSQIEVMKYRILSRKFKRNEQELNTKDHKLISVKGAEALLYSAIRDKNIQGIRTIVGGLCGDLMSKKDLTFRELQFQTIEMNLALGRLAHESLQRSEISLEPISVWIFDLNIWQEIVEEKIWQITKYQPEDRFNIESVYRFLQEHYAEDISIDSLTEYFCQSSQHISKKFKEHYDMTIVTVLRDIRIGHAKKYLQTGQLPILGIARLIGYEDENYFGKVFKKEVGISPKQYRNEVQREA